MSRHSLYPQLSIFDQGIRTHTISSHKCKDKHTLYHSRNICTGHVSTLCSLAADSTIDYLALICSTSNSYTLINSQNTIRLPVRAGKRILYPLASHLSHQHARWWPHRLKLCLAWPTQIVTEQRNPPSCILKLVSVVVSRNKMIFFCQM